MSAPPANPLADDVQLAVRSLRRSLGGVIERVCGSTPRPIDLASGFGVYRSLGWQIWNVQFLADPVEAVRHLPQPRSLKVFASAAAKKTGDTDAIARLDHAFVALRQALDKYAGDRQALDLILDSQVDNHDAELKWRKQMFQGGAFVWGVRARALLTAAILTPSKTEGFFDFTRVNALLGLTRTRSDQRWPLARVAFPKTPEPGPYKRDPIERGPVFERTGVPLMERFCSHPLPPIERRESSDGVITDDLLPGPIGQNAAMDVVTGEIVYKAGTLAEEEPGQLVRFGYSIRTPCELTIGDQLVHRSLFQGVERSIHVYSEMAGPFTGDERDEIQVRARLESLGPANERLATAEMPAYGELIDAALAPTGFRREDFDVYRIHLAYPPAPVRVAVRHPKVATSPHATSPKQSQPLRS